MALKFQILASFTFNDGDEIDGTSEACARVDRMVMSPVSMLRGICVDVAGCPFVDFRVDGMVWAVDLCGGIIGGV